MKARLLRGAAFALAWLPALACAWLVWQHSVEVPVWDDLARAPLLEAWRSGELAWSDLYAPSLESRPVLPRLVTLASASLGSGRLGVEHALAVVLIGLAALCVHGLLRRTFAGRPFAIWGATLLANLALFSTMHWQTTLWAAQLGWLVPPLAAVFCVWVLGGRLPLVAKGGLCFVACLAATWSYAHGVLLWGVVFGVVLLSHGFAPRRARAVFLGLWALAAAGVLAAYFPVPASGAAAAGAAVGGREPGLQLASFPQRAPSAALLGGALLGSPLARLPGVVAEDVAPELGWLLLWTLGLCALWAVGHAREPELWDRWLPWLAVAGFSGLSCLAVALGRSALNRWQIALWPHYLALSVYALLAVAVLGALLAEDLARRHPGSATARALGALPAVGLGALVALQAYQWGMGLDGMHEWRLARLHARTAILFLDHFEPDDWSRIAGDPEDGRRLLKQLDRAGFLEPPLLAEPSLVPFARAPALPPELGAAERAAVELGASLEEKLHVEGFAWLPGADRPADGVLLALGDRVVGVAAVNGFPRVWIEEADHIFNEVRLPGPQEMATWRGTILVESLPAAPELRLELYAVESDRMRVHPLRERVVVRRPPDGAAWAFVEGASAPPR